ncbi:MAG: VWA domain-containing protein [Phycisphaerales bacterium]
MTGALPMVFGDPAWVHAAWAAPAALAIGAWSIRSGRRALLRFADREMLGVIARSVSTPRRWTRVALVAVSFGLLALALARPQTDPVPVEIEQHGRDVVFVVDVSRSMLAQDLAPSRLERSKLWISDLAADLAGDRVGLVAFAGAAVVACPLTNDRTFFQMALDELSPRSAPIGGTYIGDAIRKAMSDVFEVDEESPDAGPVTRDIILITDGEDQESFPVEAAAAAGRAGIRIIALGVGDAGEGSLVPDPATGEPIVHAGRRVRSALDAGALAEIAGASAGGVMLNVGTGTIRLDDVYRDLTADDAARSLGTVERMRYTERFWMPLVAAFALLVIESVLSDRRRRR